MLILAREAVGLTQKELADKLSIPNSVLSKYESGVREPTAKHLCAIADELGVTVAFFELSERRFQFGSSCTYHRRRQDVTVARLRKLLAEINVLRIHLARLLQGIEIDSPIEIPRMDIEDYGGDVNRIAQLARMQMHVSPGPIPNLIQLIESAGGIVVHRPFDTPKLDAVSQWMPGMPPVFLLNSEAPVDRQRFTLAHELGHLIMHRTPTESIEKEADEFAAEFLMPAKDIGDDLDGLRSSSLRPLKLKWRTSMASIIRRAFDLNRIDERMYRAHFTALSKSGYRMREPNILEGEQPSLFDKILDIYLHELSYSEGDLCELLRISPGSLYRYYALGVPELKLA
ncbi:MAG: XRE family transcriptional regulator [Fimbriimonadales bacterium]